MESCKTTRHLQTRAVHICHWCHTRLWRSSDLLYEKKLKFSADQFAFLDVLGYVCAILSTIMYRKFFKHWSFRKVFAVGLIASFLAEQTLFLLVTHYNRVVGIPDITFAAMERVALTFVNEFLLLPMVVMEPGSVPNMSKGHSTHY